MAALGHADLGTSSVREIPSSETNLFVADDLVPLAEQSQLSDEGNLAAQSTAPTAEIVAETVLSDEMSDAVANSGSASDASASGPDIPTENDWLEQLVTTLHAANAPPVSVEFSSEIGSQTPGFIDSADTLIGGAFSDAVVLGAPDLSGILNLGQGSDTPLVFGTTILRGDEVNIFAPLNTGDLFILGDGSTTTVSANISGTSQTINDTVEVSGDRSITATAGSIFIGNPGGQIDGIGSGTNSLTMTATGSITVANGVG